MVLREKYQLYLVTARQHRNKTIEQIGALGLIDIFQDVLVTGRKQKKHELIYRSIKTSSADWIIGDTGEDIRAGKTLAINTAAVLSGIMTREQLAAYDPTKIIESVINFE